MKVLKNLHLTVAFILFASLFAASLLFLNSSGFGVGWSLFGLACCIVGAVGVVWLGWCRHKLSKEITSIADVLRSGQTSSLEPVGSRAIDDLIEILNDRFADRTEQFDEQVKDLQINTRLLQRQKRNADAIIYSIRDAVLVVDEFDKLQMANEAAGRLFGFDFQNSQLKPVSELIDSEKDGFVEFLRHCRESRVQATKREFEFSNGDDVQTFNCIVSCVVGINEQICGAVAVLHDISREKEISQMKNDFVNHVSHELKTPLASITAYSEMLVDGEAKDEDSMMEFCSVIQSQAQRLNRMIEDLLNISRIESGLVKVEKNPVSLAILIAEQLKMISSYAEENGIKITGHQLKDMIVHDQVYADKDMISQVIVNLLSNAVKYTESGGSITVEVEVDEIKSVARISVTDTGVGIGADDLEHVFDKFYRVAANKNKAKGTGLGLNLVKQIIEKVHDGRMFVESEVGQGSTFGFELPLASAEVVEMA